jgi:sulfatase modifying factor 1
MPQMATIRRCFGPLAFGWVLLAGCQPQPALAPLSAPRFPDDAGADDDDAGADDDDAGADDDDAGADDDDTGANGCPPAMARVEDEGGFCIDRFEAALELLVGPAWEARTPYGPLSAGEVVRAIPADGAVPQGYVSGEEAASACAEAGKRLCTSSEWLAACRGPAGLTWPYGAGHLDGACNDSYPGTHPVVDLFGSTDVWDSASMNDPGINQQPDTVEPGGAHASCVSAWGVYDLHGNLHEWVDDPAGTFRGGFYADAAINGPGCTYVTTAHAVSYHDYSTGFRCCV